MEVLVTERVSVICGRGCSGRVILWKPLSQRGSLLCDKEVGIVQESEGDGLWNNYACLLLYHPLGMQGGRNYCGIANNL